MSSWLKYPRVCLLSSTVLVALGAYWWLSSSSFRTNDASDDNDSLIEEFKSVPKTLDRSFCKDGCTCGCVGCLCGLGQPCKGAATTKPKCPGCPCGQADEIVCECVLGCLGSPPATSEKPQTKTRGCGDCKPGCTCGVASCTCASGGPCPPCCSSSGCCGTTPTTDDFLDL